MLHRTGTLGEDGKARLAVSDRWGGVSAGGFGELNLAGHVGDEPPAVAANRERLAAGLGLTTERVAFMSQVHGRDVAVVDLPVTPDAPVPEVDALVTRTPGLALAVLVADCVPVLLSSPAPGGTVLGVAHAGRRGVLSGVVAATLDAMRDLGASPEPFVRPGRAGRLRPVLRGARRDGRRAGRPGAGSPGDQPRRHRPHWTCPPRSPPSCARPASPTWRSTVRARPRTRICTPTGATL